MLAERRLTQLLVDRDKAASALAQTEGRTHAAVMVGRPLGALLFGISHVLPFAADSLSFCVSVGALIRVGRHQPRAPAGRPEKIQLIREMGEGFGWLKKHRFARLALILTAGTTLLGQALIMVLLGKAHAYHLSSFIIGVILAASGVGGVAGSAFAPRLFREFGYSLFNAQLTAWVVIFVGLALSGGRSFFSVAIALAILGFTGALGNIALDTYIVQLAGPGHPGAGNERRLAHFYSSAGGRATARGVLVQAIWCRNYLPCSVCHHGRVPGSGSRGALGQHLPAVSSGRTPVAGGVAGRATGPRWSAGLGRTGAAAAPAVEAPQPRQGGRGTEGRGRPASVGGHLWPYCCNPVGPVAGHARPWQAGAFPEGLGQSRGEAGAVSGAARALLTAARAAIRCAVPRRSWSGPPS